MNWDPKTLADIYFTATSDAGMPRKISPKSSQYKYLEELANKLQLGDDPYTFFKVMIDNGIFWPFEMIRESSFRIYEDWKITRKYEELSPILKSKKANILESIIKWENFYKRSNLQFKDFVFKYINQVDSYWLALKDDYEAIKEMIPYELFRKVKEARIWLRKKGLFDKLKEALNGTGK